MRKIFLAVAAVALVAGGTLGTGAAQEKLKVGFIYVGPVGDFGWT
jgi:simple sugar transport system substrate-binding protein